MAKRSERVELDRSGERRRGRAWLIPLALIVLALLAGAGWLFRPRIARLLEPAATLPPPPPTAAPGSSASGSDAGGSGGDSGVLYATDFEGEARGDWETFDDGKLSASIRDGMLVFGVNSVVDDGGWSGLNYTFDDFVLDVDATKLDGPDDNGIIVVFRLTDTGNYNRFDISSDGYYTLSVARDGLRTVISDWAASEAIQQGNATNHLTLTAVGDTFSFAVNGQPLRLCISDEEGVQPIPMPDECLGGTYVEAWTNGDLPRGKIGLGAQGIVGFDGEQTTNAVAVIGFDDVVISEP